MSLLDQLKQLVHGAVKKPESVRCPPVIAAKEEIQYKAWVSQQEAKGYAMTTLEGQQGLAELQENIDRPWSEAQTSIVKAMESDYRVLKTVKDSLREWGLDVMPFLTGGALRDLLWDPEHRVKDVDCIWQISMESDLNSPAYRAHRQKWIQHHRSGVKWTSRCEKIVQDWDQFEDWVQQPSVQEEYSKNWIQMTESKWILQLMTAYHGHDFEFFGQWRDPRVHPEETASVEVKTLVHGHEVKSKKEHTYDEKLQGVLQITQGLHYAWDVLLSFDPVKYGLHEKSQGWHKKTGPASGWEYRRRALESFIDRFDFEMCKVWSPLEDWNGEPVSIERKDVHALPGAYWDVWNRRFSLQCDQMETKHWDRVAKRFERLQKKYPYPLNIRDLGGSKRAEFEQALLSVQIQSQTMQDSKDSLVAGEDSEVPVRGPKRL